MSRSFTNHEPECLIVQIHDHRSVAPSTQTSSTNAPGSEKIAPFSIHNYNEHLTPSPYVPYPKTLQKTSGQNASANGASKETSTGIVGNATDSEKDKGKGKEPEKPSLSNSTNEA